MLRMYEMKPPSGLEPLGGWIGQVCQTKKNRAKMPGTKTQTSKLPPKTEIKL